LPQRNSVIGKVAIKEQRHCQRRHKRFQNHIPRLTRLISETLPWQGQRYEVKTVTEATTNLIETVDLLGLNKQVSRKFEHRLQKVIDVSLPKTPSMNGFLFYISEKLSCAPVLMVKTTEMRNCHDLPLFWRLN
jgi:hypothetical protein